MRLNARLVHGFEYSYVKDRLAAVGADGGEAFWNAVRPNLTRVGEASDWLTLVQGPVTPLIEDAVYAARAAEALPDGDLDETSWGSWTSALKEATGRKGKDLFKPLRLALTGQERGPEMAVLLPLIGSETAKKRLLGEVA